MGEGVYSRVEVEKLFIFARYPGCFLE